VSLEDLLAGRVAYPLVTLAFGARPRAVFLWSVVDAWRDGRGRYDVAGISDASPEDLRS